MSARIAKLLRRAARAESGRTDGAQTIDVRRSLSGRAALPHSKRGAQTAGLKRLIANQTPTPTAR